MDKEKNGFRNDPHDNDCFHKKVNTKDSSKQTSLKGKNVVDPHDPDHHPYRANHFEEDSNQEKDSKSIPRTADPHDPNHPTNRENKSKSDKQQDSISDDFTVFNDPHDPEHPRND